MIVGTILLALLTLERLFELVVANRNTRCLLAQGGREYGRAHYPAMVLMHVTWIVCLWWWGLGKPVNALLIVAALLAQLGRWWVVTTLKGRWTTRIITVPGLAPIRSGPYRFLRHPNYAIVILEIAVVPLAFGLWRMAILFSLLNALMLTVRIRAENWALAEATRQDPLPSAVFPPM